MWDEALEELAGKARNQRIRVVVIEPGQRIREGEMVITCIQPGNMGIKSEDVESRPENTVPGTGSAGLESAEFLWKCRCLVVIMYLEVNYYRKSVCDWNGCGRKWK